MQKILFFLLLTLAFPALAQTKRQVKKEVAEQINDGWDIVIPPSERTPKNKTSLKRTSAAALTNWGKEYLLPFVVQQRMASECQNPVVLKIFDTGGKVSHSFLQEGQLPGTSYTGEPQLEDGQGHGTHVAGICAANEIGLVYALVSKGVVKWKPVKVLNNGGMGSWSFLSNALTGELSDDKKLIQSGTGVVYSASLGGPSPVASVETALKESAGAGIVTVCASGNSGIKGVNYPASSPYTLACASIDQDLKRSSFSTFGKEVDNAMPGGKIQSTYKGNTFATLSGTSMATPFLSSACVVALSKWGPVLQNVDKMRSYLAWVATDLERPGRDDSTGYGACLILSILDKNPANMPGDGPVDPPKVKRTLNFTFGSYTLNWHPNIKINPTQHRTSIVKVEVAFESDLPVAEAYNKARQILDAFYLSRTVIVFPTNDFADVTKDEVSAIVRAYSKAGYLAKVLRLDASESGVSLFWE